VSIASPTQKNFRFDRHTRRHLSQLGKNIVENLRDLAPLDSRGRLSGHSRRLSDKLLLAFHQACDQKDALVALQLLSILESMLTRRPHHVEFSRRRSMNTLVAAHERLWHIRHPEEFVQSDLADQTSTERKEIHCN
jgi:hypothetical protein